MAIATLEFAAIGTPITRVGVSLVPVFLPTNKSLDIRTGPGSGLQIDEMDHATVPTLQVGNPTNKPILIPAGQQFTGGKQNRKLNVSVVVAPHSRTEVPVSCLEQGRWGRREKFRHAPSFAPRRVRRTSHREVARSVERGRMSGEERDAALGRLAPATELDALGDCDLVIEAVFEDLETKQSLFRALHPVCAPGAIFASNTSTLSITEIASGCGREDRRRCFATWNFAEGSGKGAGTALRTGLCSSRQDAPPTSASGATERLARTCFDPAFATVGVSSAVGGRRNFATFGSGHCVR